MSAGPDLDALVAGLLIPFADVAALVEIRTDRGARRFDISRPHVREVIAKLREELRHALVAGEAHESPLSDDFCIAIEHSIEHLDKLRAVFAPFTFKPRTRALEALRLVALIAAAIGEAARGARTVREEAGTPLEAEAAAMKQRFKDRTKDAA